MMRVASVLLLVWSLVAACLQPAYAAEVPIKVAHWEDSSTKTRIEEIPDQPFTPTGTISAWGFSRSVHWLRIQTDTDLTGPALLSIGLPNLDDVRLYVPSGQGKWREQRTGDEVAYNNRSYPSPFLAFVLEQQDLRQPVYLRIESGGTNAVVLDLRPLREGQAEEHALILKHMAMFGVQLVSIAICLGLFVSARDWLLLGFCVSQLVWLVAAFVFLGYGSILFPDRPVGAVYTAVGTLSFLLDMAFHMTLIHRFAPPRTLMRISVALVCLTWIAVPLVALFDVTSALQLRSASSLIVIVLLAVMAATARNASLLPLWLIRGIYGVYLTLILTWMLPILGLAEASRLASHAVLMHGTVNFALILSVVAVTGLRQRSSLFLAQARLREAEAAREAHNRTIEAQSNLMSMMSHEVGTSLAIISLAMAQEKVSDRNQRRIGRAISNLERTITDLNNADRIAGGELKLRPVSVQVGGRLRELVKDLNDVRLKLDIRDEIDILFDPEMLDLVIRHLLENACKYAQPATDINVSLTQSPTTDAVFLTIENTLRDGPPPDPGRLCEKYYRDPHVFALPGSGIGLFLVNTLTQKSDARFSITLRDRSFVAKLELKTC